MSVLTDHVVVVDVHVHDCSTSVLFLLFVAHCLDSCLPHCLLAHCTGQSQSLKMAPAVWRCDLDSHGEEEQDQ